MIASLLQFAKQAEEREYDARNEAICLLAKQIKPILENQGHLPLV